MTVLETFFMLFSTNADEAEKELGGLEKQADKTADAADKASDKLKKVGKESSSAFAKARENSDKLKKSLLETDSVSKSLANNFMQFAKGLVLPLAGAFSISGLVSIAKTRADEIDQLSKAADKIKMPVGDFEAFGRAARDMGGDVKAAENDLKNLYTKIGEAAINPKSDPAKQFANMGVKLKDANGQMKTTYEVMLSLAKASEKMNQAQAIARMRKLGITDEGTIQLILSGKTAVEAFMEAQRKNGVVTQEQAEIVGRYKAEVDNFGDVMKSIGNQVASYILPVLTKLSQWFRQLVGWITDNGNLVKGFFIGLAAVLTGMYLPAIVKAIAATIAFLAPWIGLALAIGAVGAAMALLYEDYRAYVDGQPSLLADLEKKYTAVAKAIDLVKEAHSGIPEVNRENFFDLPTFEIIPDSYLDRSVQGFARMFKKIGELAEDFLVELSNYWDNSSAGLSRMATDVKQAFADAWKAVSDYFQNSKDGVLRLIAEIKGAFAGLIDGVKQLWNDMFSYILGKLDALIAKIKGAWNYVFGGGDEPPAGAGAGAGAYSEEALKYLNGTANTPQPDNPQMRGAASSANTPVNGSGGLLDLSQKTIGNMNSSPFNTASPATVSGQVKNDVKVDKSVKQTVGSVTINTQATDPQGIANGIASAIQGSFRDTAQHFDDGVLI